MQMNGNKKIFSKIMIIPMICILASLWGMCVKADETLQDAEGLLASSSLGKSINVTGTFHDNSWDGVPLKNVDASKDDSKKIWCMITR